MCRSSSVRRRRAAGRRWTLVGRDSRGSQGRRIRCAAAPSWRRVRYTRQWEVRRTERRERCTEDARGQRRSRRSCCEWYVRRDVGGVVDHDTGHDAKAGAQHALVCTHNPKQRILDRNVNENCDEKSVQGFRLALRWCTCQPIDSVRPLSHTREMKKRVAPLLQAELSDSVVIVVTLPFSSLPRERAARAPSPTDTAPRTRASKGEMSIQPLCSSRTCCNTFSQRNQ